jgi:hypothetical protein
MAKFPIWNLPEEGGKELRQDQPRGNPQPIVKKY